ncbi:MAG TPA: hypothetical protein VFI31_24825 [Pirellulales bacterium]|nr:hypothetical protein [Pirellulales bacterium]
MDEQEGESDLADAGDEDARQGLTSGSADPAGASEGVIRCWDAKSDFSGYLE